MRNRDWDKMGGGGGEGGRGGLQRQEGLLLQAAKHIFPEIYLLRSLDTWYLHGS